MFIQYRFLLLTAVVVLLLTGCNSACLTGEVLNTTSNLCQNCSTYIPSCVECSSTTICTKCSTTTFLVVSSNTCSTTCPAGTYTNTTLRTCVSCPTLCLTCSSSTSCKTCITSAFLLNLACTPCIQKFQDCYSCTTIACSKCMLGYSLSGSLCQKIVCPFGYFVN